MDDEADPPSAVSGQNLAVGSNTVNFYQAAGGTATFSVSDLNDT